MSRWLVSSALLFSLSAPLVPLRAQIGAPPSPSWLTIGDAHAEHADPASLELALAAYARVLERRSHPDYTAALARSAWVAFLLDRGPEAVAWYAELVDRIDAMPAPDLEERAEALRLLGAMFADPDWDRDGLPDGAGALARLSDATLVSPAHRWLPELYFATARALYLTCRDAEAIVVLDHALSRWPAPPSGTELRAACRRHRARLLAVERPETQPETDAICAARAPAE